MEDKVLEVLEHLTKIVEKQNNIILKMAKALYLIPASEKEMKDILNTRNNNIAKSYEAYKETEKLKNENDISNIYDMYNDVNAIYGDVLADDFMPKGGNE